MMESLWLGDSMWHRSMGRVVRGFTVSAVMLYAGWVPGQGSAAPTAEEIVARMLLRSSERQAALEHYASERTYRVEYTGTGGEHSGKLVVDAEYSAPDRKRFTVVSESGSKLICEKVLKRLVESEQEATQKANRIQMTLSTENYNMALDGTDQIDGVKAWVLKVSPKIESKFTYKGRVWVSMDDYAVMRVQGEPAKNPSWWINRASFDSRYVRRGEFWLPERNVSTSHVRIGGEARLTIDYGAYSSLEGHSVENGAGGGEKVGSAGGSAAVDTVRWAVAMDRLSR
jgi:hypothetical protein